MSVLPNDKMFCTCPPWCNIVGATVTVHQFFCILHFCYTCSLCRVELVVQFPARGSTQVLFCLFTDVLWLWLFLYSVGPHPVSNLHIYTFVVSRALMAGAASHAGDVDSSQAPGLTSGLQGSVNVHRGALLLVPQWQCISSFAFYIHTALNLPSYFALSRTDSYSPILPTFMLCNIISNILVLIYNFLGPA